MGKRQMKITVNKEFTTLSQLPKVKDDIKEFKARYTDGDLKSMFCDVVNDWTAYGAEIISVSGEAFPGGYVYNDETQFHIEIICRKYGEFVVLRFYCDLE